MRVNLAQKAIGLFVALAVVVAAPGGVALAAKKSDAQKCQKEIDKASQQFTKARLKQLFNCGKKAFKKDQDVATCVANSKVTKVSVSKGQKNKINKSCPPAVITGAASENALGMTSCVTRAADCPAPTDGDSLTQCIECSHAFESECLFRTVYNKSTAACEAP
jgi:hypothetical protein